MQHLFDNENDEMSEVYRKVRRPVFIDSNKDYDVQDLILLAFQMYELEACRLEEAAKGLPTIKGVPEVSKYG